MKPAYLGTIGTDSVKLGSELTPTDQAHVLSAFIYRHTGDHKPPRMRYQTDLVKNQPPLFKDDQEWLANTYFAVTKSGKFNHRFATCESHPIRYEK